MVVYMLNVIFDYRILKGNTMGMRLMKLEMQNVNDNRKIGFVKFTIINVFIAFLFIFSLKYPLHFFTLISMVIPSDIISGEYQSPLGFLLNYKWSEYGSKG